MFGERGISPAHLYAGLLVLARVAGVFVYLPVGSFRSGPDAAKIFLSLAITICLLPQWPRLETASPTPGKLAVWLICDATLGLLIGLSLALATECFVFAAQTVALQAGYSYASTIDPTSQADSGVLQVLAQLVVGLLFFVAGVDREMIRVFARTLEVFPPGSFTATPAMADNLQRLGGTVFRAGLSLALPVIGLLVLTDLALALLSRAHAQLQLLSLAFPAKMLLALFATAAFAGVLPAVYQRQLHGMFQSLNELFR